MNNGKGGSLFLKLWMVISQRNIIRLYVNYTLTYISTSIQSLVGVVLNVLKIGLHK